jgi:carbon-monoxide dehydrogenase large subunit
MIGKSIPRVEDLRFITGSGRYTDDLVPANARWAYIVRSPHAHAFIKSIDTSSAAACPGVAAVLTAADYRADGNKDIVHHVIGPDAVDATRSSLIALPGKPIFERAQYPLASEKVRFVGEAVAVVIADTLEQARDAAESVEIDYEVLPATFSSLDALAKGAPQIWADAPGNECFHLHFGDAAATDKAFTEAAHIIEHVFDSQRIVTCQMEPRAAVGYYDRDDASYTLVAGGQGVSRYRITLAAALSVDLEKTRVISPDVGGAFGSRTSLNPEGVLVCWAAKRVGTPVRWVSDRTEAFLTDYQGRDLVTRAAMALDHEGRILAIRAEHYGNVGAHTVSFVPLANGYRLVTTVYDVPAVSSNVHAVLTNTAPVTPFRGAGRPEATFIIERLLDMAAQRFGLDRIEIRRRNIVPKHRFPYRNIMGLTYDSGDFQENMERALSRSEWASFPSRRAASRERGLLLGIGIANYVEAPVGAIRERVILTIRPDRTVEIVAGTLSSGQGHETVYAQVVSDRLRLPFESIKLTTGDTDLIKVGGGTHSDRSMRLVGTLLFQACEKIILEGREIASRMFDRPAADVKFTEGLFSAPPLNQTLSLFDLALSNGELSVMTELFDRIPAYPTGAAVCELEVDPETGVASVARYTSIDDVGQPINPMIVDGQVHGGIAQGVGQALYESLGIDRDMGQVVGASFMDYCLPRADLLPSFDIELTEDCTRGNPLRVKGAGECGITPAAAAVINALVDALRDHGIEDVAMPATPDRVWKAIAEARKGLVQ